MVEGGLLVESGRREVEGAFEDGGYEIGDRSCSFTFTITFTKSCESGKRKAESGRRKGEMGDGWRVAGNWWRAPTGSGRVTCS